MTGSSKQTTQTNSNAPWANAQPALNTAITGAQDLYKAGTGGEVYKDSTVIPWSSQSTQAMNNIQKGATANSGGAGLSGQYQGIINNGGMNSGLQAAANTFNGIANGSGLTSEQQSALGGFNNIAAAGGYNADMKDALGGYNSLQSNPFNSYQNSALQNTQGLANSQYQITPELQKVLDAQSSQASNSVNASASGAGRYGSGIHQQTLANTIGDLTNRTVYNDYTNFQGRKDAANSNLFNMGQTGVNTQMGANSAIGSLGQTALGNQSNAYGNVANIGQAGLTNRMGAAGNVASIGQQALGNLGTAYTGMQAPNTDLMNVGAMNEDYATRMKNDQLRIFNETQNRPWEQIGRLNAIASGAGQMGSTQTQSTPGANPFLQALGYGSSAAGLLGSFL